MPSAGFRQERGKNHTSRSGHGAARLGKVDFPDARAKVVERPRENRSVGGHQHERAPPPEMTELGTDQGKRRGVIPGGTGAEHAGRGMIR